MQCMRLFLFSPKKITNEALGEWLNKAKMSKILHHEFSQKTHSAS